MRKLIVLSVLVSAAVLAPAGSAQAAWQTDSFCIGQGGGQTLTTTQNCTSWPLNVGEIYVSFKVVTPGSGAICVGLTQYGGAHHGDPVPGAPGYSCATVTGMVAGQDALVRWYFTPYHNPPTTYRYGQARIVNVSNATLKTIGGNFTWVAHWL